MASDDTTTRRTAPATDAGYLIDGQQRYRVDGRLGAGGFGVVFRCFHEQTASWVAIKRLSVPESDAMTLVREATRLGDVDSDHIAKPRTAFYDATSSLLYIVSDLAAEGDLRQYLHDRQSPLPIPEAVNLALGIARGLTALHGQRIWHRDLKPANVLLFRRDHRILPRIGDFGLARHDVSLSLGECVSPGYSAPEQLAFERCGPETDLFSFGLVLYELLTGQPAARSRELTEYASWVAALRATPLPRPSLSRPELAAWPALDDLVERLTSYDCAARRGLAATDVVAQLEAVAAGEGQTVAAPRRTAVTGKDRARAATAVLVLVVSVLAGAGLVWLLREGAAIGPPGTTPAEITATVGGTGRANVAARKTERTSARVAPSPNDVRPPVHLDADSPTPLPSITGGEVSVQPPMRSASQDEPQVQAPVVVESPSEPQPRVDPPSKQPVAVPAGPPDRGDLIAIDGPRGVDDPSRRRTSPPSWAIGRFSAGNCFDRETICRLEIKNAESVTLFLRKRIADMYSGPRPVSTEQRFDCTWLPGFESVSCRMKNGGSAGFDLSEARTGIRLTTADRTASVEMAREGR